MTRFATFLSALGLAACAVPEMPVAQEGALLFAENCASCHGVNAQGDGELAAVLSPTPPDLTQISTRNGGTFPRAKMLSVIDGYAQGRLDGRAMPEFGEIFEGDLVPIEVDGTLTPTPRPLAALLAYLEAVQR